MEGETSKIEKKDREVEMSDREKDEERGREEGRGR